MCLCRAAGLLAVGLLATLAAADEPSWRQWAKISKVQAHGDGWGGAWREQLDDELIKGNNALLSIHDMQFHSAAFTRLLSATITDSVRESSAQPENLLISCRRVVLCLRTSDQTAG